MSSLSSSRNRQSYSGCRIQRVTRITVTIMGNNSAIFLRMCRSCSHRQTVLGRYFALGSSCGDGAVRRANWARLGEKKPITRVSTVVAEERDETCTPGRAPDSRVTFSVYSLHSSSSSALAFVLAFIAHGRNFVPFRFANSIQARHSNRSRSIDMHPEGTTMCTSLVCKRPFRTYLNAKFDQPMIHQPQPVGCDQ